MFLIFDTETTGLPKDYNAPVSDSDNWPRLVQLAWQLHDEKGNLLDAKNYIVKPEGFTIPFNAAKIHGITTERAEKDGHPLSEVLEIFNTDLAKTKYVAGHNIDFDVKVTGAEYYRKEQDTNLLDLKQLDTKDLSVEFCAIPGGRGGRFKWPTLTELHTKLFGVAFEDAHDAAYDVDATAKCFFGLIERRVFKVAEIENPDEVTYEAPDLADANFKVASELERDAEAELKKAKKADISELEDVPFSHLHCHTQFSILQATSAVNEMIDRAVELGMPAMAMTDHGNMMAAFHFVRAALAKDITPVIGCEFNLCENMHDKSRQDNGFQTVVLAKNKRGYHNLAKLSSLAYTQGFYYVPRIDKEALLKYKEDLIISTGGLWGEVPFLTLNVGETQAEEAFQWYKENFGDDFYVELNRHGVQEEDIVNEFLLGLAKKYDVKYFAANNTYYNERENAQAHDILLCVKDAESVNKPKKYIGKRGREFRYGFPNDEFYIKTPEEMKKLFADLPEAIETTNEIVGKIERFELARDVLLPKFDFPEKFKDPKDEEDGGNRGENNYLRHITYEGAKKRYGEITDEIRERLDFELETIANTGYPGYFLIVQDFTNKAREMDVSVGPGRGSAAGSAVAYCTGITNVDPIKYDLLFERFLNPDRVSMPDIDIDFDDEGRQRVIDYVIEKYGANQVAQIITYGTMAAKSSIRDTGRVLELPLPDTDRIAKLIPDIKLAKLFEMDDKALADKLKNNQEDLQKANELKRISTESGLEAETVNQARVLEGSVRNTGIHACGVIITPDDITNFVPVALAKDSDMWCTQFDNSVAEDAGLLKMDFLGLKTLTLIKDAVKNVKKRHDIDLDPDEFPLDDEKTYELFQRGATVGIFQYESAGMQKYMRELKPTVFADLIAMNALYRPGPLEYIPSFIRRKHGTEEVAYDLEACKEYLEETYGITVYQEQVMLLSQKLAGFTKGEADTLRKAMGKKKFDLLAKLKPQFLNQGGERGHDKKILEKIWKDWEAFASYAFNKSHSTCYAWVAYQTAYLKAHYPAEYMASVLSNNMNDIKQVTFFMEECKRMGVPVLGPSVNESEYKFVVNEKGEIRFGLGAVKGVGKGAIESIVEQRNEDGPFHSIFDFVKRIDLRSANKRTLESLCYAGAFDCWEGINRSQYFAQDQKGIPFLEMAVRFGNANKTGEDAAQQSLFGGDSEVEIPEPPIPSAEEWGTLDKLSKEREVVGIYLSGHPLNDFKLEIENFCNEGGLKILKDLTPLKNKTVKLAGMVTESAHRLTKHNKPFGVFTLEDFEDSHTFFVFGDTYVKYREYFVESWFLFIEGKVEPRRYAKSDDELEFRLNKVELLSDLREKAAGQLNLFVGLRDISEDLIDRVYQLLEDYPGTCKLCLEIEDEERQLKMPARIKGVELTNEVITKLEQMPEIRYSVKES
ncbi:DNA polymerase III subunit alpha [Halocola ammonii]